MAEHGVQWCTNCGARFVSAELPEGTAGCPKCGSTGVPCDAEQDVWVQINWHELRILGIWADNWAAQSKEKDASLRPVVQAIAHRLERQHPERSPLTLGGELRQVRAAGFKIEQISGPEAKELPVEIGGPGAVGCTGQTLVETELLETALRHLEHMANWVANQKAGYSFEALGEDDIIARLRAKLEGR